MKSSKDKIERLKELRKESQSKRKEPRTKTKVWSDAPHHYAIRVGSEVDVLKKNRKN